jgi:hypothetical protein
MYVVQTCVACVVGDLIDRCGGEEGGGRRGLSLMEVECRER